MDLFCCDKCKLIAPKGAKRGRLIVQELGEGDGMAHPALYNRKLELCTGCFRVFKGRMDQTARRPTFEEDSDITRDAAAMTAMIITEGDS